MANGRLAKQCRRGVLLLFAFSAKDYVGFSNWPAWAAAKTLGLQREHGWARFKAAELYYLLVGRDLEHELVPFVQDAGIGVLVWSPLAGGFLSGKYTRENPKSDGGRLTGFDMLPYDKE